MNRHGSKPNINSANRLKPLFNNAGVIYIERFTSQSYEKVSRIFDTNLKGALMVAQEAARHMSTRDQGSIINIA